MARSAATLLLPALLAWGCGDDSPPTTGATTLTSTTDAGVGCEPGSVPLDDGGCRPAGVAQCGIGFHPDDAGGCVAVLPASPCEPGSMAVPGDSSCRPPAPCADPVDEPGAEHVDAAYTGGASDGSPAKPWTTIQDAVDAAQDGALVAVAPGSYAETTLVAGKRVRIVGRCAAEVEIVGGAGAPAALRLFAGSDGSEVRGLAITGSGMGVLAQHAQSLVLEGLWIHDTGDVGLKAQSTGAATSIAVRDALFERNDGNGVLLLSATGQIERVEVRDVGTDAYGHGFGFFVVSQAARAAASIKSARVQRAGRLGIAASAADVDLDATLVQDTLPTPGYRHARGVEVQDDGPGRRSRLTAHGLVVERNVETGVLVVGSDAVLEDVVARDTQAASNGTRGVGIAVENDFLTGEIADAQLRWILAERNHSAGVAVIGSTALFEGLAVRDGLPTPSFGGRGFAVQGDLDTGDRAVVTARWSAIERNQEVGIFVGTADLTLEASLVRDTQPNAAGQFGDGIVMSSAPGSQSTLVLRDGLVAHSARAGLGVFGSSAQVAGTRFECNAFAIDGEPLPDFDYVLSDLGGNVCGCEGATEPCGVVSASLAPPEPF